MHLSLAGRISTDNSPISLENGFRPSLRYELEGSSLQLIAEGHIFCLKKHINFEFNSGHENIPWGELTRLGRRVIELLLSSNEIISVAVDASTDQEVLTVTLIECITKDTLSRITSDLAITIRAINRPANFPANIQSL